DFSYWFLIGSGRAGSARNGGERAGAQPGRVVADAMRARGPGGYIAAPLPGQCAVAGKRRWAGGDSFWEGQGGGTAVLIWRTLTRTSAPILNSLRRIVPQVASANCVCRRAIWRKAQTST